MEMHSLIDQLEDLAQHAIHVPASSKILLDEAALRDLIQQMRVAVPDEVRLGQRIAGERERILAEARAQARRMTEEAQAQLNARLDEQALVQAARQRAREIVGEAEQRANSLRADSNQYVIAQLSSLEARLQRILREVQGGQRVLSQPEAGRKESGGE
jgi:vacuolar-type H+-ATPase subunit H